VPGVEAVAVAQIERSRRVVAASVAATAAATVAAAAAVAAVAVPARHHRADWVAERCWPRVRPRQPRCCTTSRRDQAWRVPTRGYCAERCQEPERTPLFGGRQLRWRLDWAAGRRRWC